jgi:hypothetical protein
MSYQNTMDKLVADHYAEYQDELTLGRKLHECLEHNRPYMPNGYPLVVYHPRVRRDSPQTTRYASKPTSGILSNGVPKVLSGELIEGYLLGVYNPRVV